MKELIKLLRILIFLSKVIIKAIFLNSRESKNILTSIYLQELMSYSKIKQIILDVSEEDVFLISSLQLKNQNERMEDRFSLLSYQELFSLIILLKKNKPKKIFEFGLMKGGSLCHFFLNTNTDVTIDSLDINFKNLSPFVEAIVKKNHRITLHLEDSRLFNCTQYAGKMDFIFIDGGHDYDIIKNDTEKAMQMLSSQGIILWDDYNPNFQGIFKYLNELSKKEKNLFHIKGTSMVFLDKKHSAPL